MALFRLDEYNRVAREAIYEWIDLQTLEHAPSLRHFPRISVENVRTTRRTTFGGEATRVDPIHRQDAGKMDIGEVTAGRFDQLRESFDAVAAARARAMVAFWQQQVDRGLTTGAIVKGKGSPTWDSIMDALEGLEFGFDEEQLPVFKSVAGPSAAELLDSLGPRDNEQERRWQQLMARKMKDWSARQRRRRMA